MPKKVENQTDKRKTTLSLEALNAKIETIKGDRGKRL